MKTPNFAITEEWIQAVGREDKNAVEELFALLDVEIRIIARNRMRNERAGHTLQTTALINEAFIVIREQKLSEESLSKFLGVVTTTMKRVLIDYARKKNAIKRGRGVELVPLDQDSIYKKDGLLALIDILSIRQEFNSLDQTSQSVLLWRVVFGKTIEETATILGISDSSVKKYHKLGIKELKKRLQ